MNDELVNANKNGKSVRLRYAALAVAILILLAYLSFHWWWNGLVTYCPPAAAPAIGDSEYYRYGEVISHEDRTLTEVTPPEEFPTHEQWRKGFLAFMDTGIFYPFQRHWRRFLRMNPGTELPYVELRLKTRNTSGDIVDVMAGTVMSFEWISDEITFEEKRAMQKQAQIRSRIVCNADLYRKNELTDEKQKVMTEHNVELASQYNTPYGVTAIRIPMLPADIEHHFPAIARKIRKNLYSDYSALRAGEWYRAHLFLKKKDLQGLYRNIYEGNCDGNGEWLFAYFKAPLPDVVKPGQILSIDLLVVPYLFPPFHPTSEYSKERVEKGEHIKPMPSVRMSLRSAFKEGIMRYCE